MIELLLAFTLFPIGMLIYLVHFGSKECFKCGVRLDGCQMPIYSNEFKGKRLCRNCKSTELNGYGN